MKRKMIIAVMAAMVLVQAAGCGSAASGNGEVQIDVEKKTTDAEGTAGDQKEMKVEDQEKAERQEKELKLMESGEDKEDQVQTEDQTDVQTEDQMEENDSNSSDDTGYEWLKEKDNVDLTYYDDHSVTIQVPENLLWCDLDDNDGVSQQFETRDGDIYAGAIISEKYAEIDESFCDEEVWVPYYAKDGKETEVKAEKIDGRTVYYHKVTYDDENYKGEPATYQKMIAVCELEDGYFIEVDLNGLSNIDLDFSMIEDFFENIQE